MAATWTARESTPTKSRRPLLIAVVFGLLSAFLVFRLLSAAQSSPAAVSTVPVVVAAQDIAPRTVVTEGMLTVKQVPVSVRLAAAFTESKTAVGQVAKSQIAAGEQVLSSKLATSAKELGFSGAVPDGFRGVSINAAEVVADGGLIQPGDHVDVVAVFQKFDAGPDDSSFLVKDQEIRPKRYVAATLAQNVLVLAVAQQSTDPLESTPQGKVTTKAQSDLKTVTLAVTPEDAQKIFLGDQAGALRLSLHRFDDDKPVTLQSIDNNVPTIIDNTPPAPIANTARVVATPQPAGH